MRSYLQTLGASAVLSSDQLEEPGKIMASERWAGVIDTVGGNILSQVIPSVKYRGCIASCGNTAGVNFSSNVLPFILRGVTLSGIESNYCPIQTRKVAWGRISESFPRKLLPIMTTEVKLDEVFDVATAILSGNIKGRTVVNLHNS